MSEYLPSFIVEPVLRQARRFSERLGGEDSPTTGPTSSFALPAVPDFQRFYPTRFWSQSPLPTTPGGGESIGGVTLDGGHVPEESTLRSIARNIHLWASQINNLDIEDEVIQEPVLPSIEHDDAHMMASAIPLTEEPANIEPGTGIAQLAALESIRETGSRSLPVLDQLRHPPRTLSETSINPANELSYQSQILEHNAQGRSHSDPFAEINAADALASPRETRLQDEYRENTHVRTSDGSGLLPEDDGNRLLRQKINAIWAGNGTALEKSKLVHLLMTERYQSGRSKFTPTSSATNTSPPFRATSPLSLMSVKSDEAAFNLSAADLQPTYAPLDADEVVDEITGEAPKPVLGCLHYKRNVKMQCAACDKWYTCRICHDEKEDHQLPRRETKHMLCMICSTPQRVSQVCKMCHTQAAYYYCSTCKLWNNDANKSIYHCEDCGICRLGQGLGKDFFHCKTCAACMSIAAESTHRCIEKSTKCDCPICGEFMFTSSQPVTFMRCGHSIHDACFTEWCNTSYKCPICSKSIANMESQFRRLDRHIEEQPMPAEYSLNRAYVFCNDCHSRSVVKYHWLGLKCGECDSYNTAQLEVLGAESPIIQERHERAQELGVGEAGITASQSHTPTEELVTPASRPSTGQVTPATTSSIARQGSMAGTPRSAIAVPGRRDSPFRNLPHSPTRSARAMSPVVGSYFGTGQRQPSSETRRGSYFSVLSFGGNSDEPNAPNTAIPQQTNLSPPQTRPSRLSQSHCSAPQELDPTAQDIHRGGVSLDNDEDMDFWGGHSPRSHDADIVDLDLEYQDEEEESSSDEEMEYDEDDGDEDEDPMDILIGHR